MNTKTPRTDSEVQRVTIEDGGETLEYIHPDFARTLESELNEANEHIERLEKRWEDR